MAMLKSPPRPPKNETLQIRVEEQIKTKLHKYAQFINSSEAYVVSEMLKRFSAITCFPPEYVPDSVPWAGTAFGIRIRRFYARCRST
jgi:hypothetical protein